MRNSGPTFESPSSPGVKHDYSNLLVEFLMINKYGVLNPFPWRKNQPLAKEWGEACKVVRRLLKTLKIQPERLAWYIHSQNITELDYAEFGLVRWKVNRVFPKANPSAIAAKYVTAIQREKDKLEADARIDSIVSYVPKKQSSKKRKTLTDIIGELENGCSGTEAKN